MGVYDTMTCPECGTVFNLSQGHTCTTQTEYFETKVNVPAGSKVMTQTEFNACITKQRLRDAVAGEDGYTPSLLGLWCFCQTFYNNTDWIEAYSWRRWMPATIPVKLQDLLAADLSRLAKESILDLKKRFSNMPNATRVNLAGEAAKYYFGVVQGSIDPKASVVKTDVAPIPKIEEHNQSRPIAFEE